MVAPTVPAVRPSRSARDGGGRTAPCAAPCTPGPSARAVDSRVLAGTHGRKWSGRAAGSGTLQALLSPISSSGWNPRCSRRRHVRPRAASLVPTPKCSYPHLSLTRPGLLIRRRALAVRGTLGMLLEHKTQLLNAVLHPKLGPGLRFGK